MGIITFIVLKKHSPIRALRGLSKRLSPQTNKQTNKHVDKPIQQSTPCEFDLCAKVEIVPKMVLEGFRLEGLVVVTGVSPVAKGLTDVTISSLLILTAVVGGVEWGVRHLHLSGTFFCIMEVEAVTYVTEEPGWDLLFGGAFVKTAEKMVGDIQGQGVSMYIKLDKWKSTLRGRGQTKTDEMLRSK